MKFLTISRSEMRFFGSPSRFSLDQDEARAGQRIVES
jgi:hypothetical protein